MPTYKGAFSPDFESKVTGLSRDAYYPSRTPNKYVTDDGKSPIQLDTDNISSRSEWPSGARGKGGFSGVVSRNRKG
jgi:hypothetical protein